MKTARVHIPFLEFSCPNCLHSQTSTICNEQGEELFNLNESLPPIVICDGCRKALRVPTAAFRIQAKELRS